MEKISANLLKAIEGKTNAWQRLSIDDILKLSTAYKNIYEAEMMKQDILDDAVNAHHFGTIREISAAYRDICEAESFSNVVFLDENNNIKLINDIMG